MVFGCCLNISLSSSVGVRKIIISHRILILNFDNAATLSYCTAGTYCMYAKISLKKTLTSCLLPPEEEHGGTIDTIPIDLIF